MIHSDSILRVQLVIAKLLEGGVIVLVDDKDREDEGDLVCLGSSVSAEIISFMMNQGRGLICASISEKKRETLGLPLQVEHNEATFGTNFGVPFNYYSLEDSGISASSRARTIRELSSDSIDPTNFVSPGYVIPVIGREGGVLTRRGQTEGSLDLAKFANDSEVAVICEILAEDGSVLRGSALIEFSEAHKLPMCSIEDIVQYRKLFDVSVREVLSRDMSSAVSVSSLRESLGLSGGKSSKESKDSRVRFFVFVDDVDQAEHFALVIGELADNIKVRIHSECLTGDVFGSLRCDCGDQLDLSLKTFIEDGAGVLVYLRQEGRGIGLLNKLKAYELQEKGYDTVEANEILGFKDDQRDYKIAGNILKALGLNRIKLVTNNPKKYRELSKVLEITERISIEVQATSENLSYLKTKKNKLGHFFKQFISSRILFLVD